MSQSIEKGLTLKNYKQIYLGRRKTIEEAAALYRAAQIKYHGEFANFD